MARIVHFLHRIGSRPAYRERAEELVHRPCPPSEERGEEESWVRVVECFQPSQGAEVADLALSERELPEVISVMHEADEVHVHGLNLEVTLRLLPYVHPESLRSTPLVIHGPVPTLERELEKDATRFQAWPGPVIYDALAEREAEKKEGERIPVWLDQSAAELLPRPNGAKPLVDDQGNKVAVISLEADLPATFKTTLEVATGRAIEAKGKGTTALRLEFRDEERCSLAERSRERRVSQVAIGRGGPEGAPWDRRILLESIAQGVPFVALIEPGAAASSELPPGIEGVAYDGLDEAASAERVAEMLVSWMDTWLRGEAAPVDTQTARRWLDEAKS